MNKQNSSPNIEEAVRGAAEEMQSRGGAFLRSHEDDYQHATPQRRQPPPAPARPLEVRQAIAYLSQPAMIRKALQRLEAWPPAQERWADDPAECDVILPHEADSDPHWLGGGADLTLRQCCASGALPRRNALLTEQEKGKLIEERPVILKQAEQGKIPLARQETAFIERWDERAIEALLDERVRAPYAERRSRPLDLVLAGYGQPNGQPIWLDRATGLSVDGDFCRRVGFYIATQATLGTANGRAQRVRLYEVPVLVTVGFALTAASEAALTEVGVATFPLLGDFNKWCATVGPQPGAAAEL